MEKERQIKDEKSIFYDRLLAEGLVDEVRPGLAVKAEDYIFVKGDELLVQDLIAVLTGYLARPTLVDSFPSHEDRILAFNKSGVLDSDTNKKLYLSNRLRVNNILSVFGSLGVSVDEWTLPESFRNFVESEKRELDLKGYDSLDTDEKILFTERLAAICINVLNRAIAENIIKGPIL